MRRQVLISSALVAVLALPVGVGSSASAAPADRTEPSAQVWVTTPDRAELMAEREPVPFTVGPGQEPTIVVDPSRTYQSVAGVGASITDSSAQLLYQLDPQVREETMRQLFDPASGIGISALRQPIGSSDFTDEEHYTLDDVGPGETDFGLDRFSIAHDEEQILPLLREAKALNPDLMIIATPWSQPAWMKTNDSLIGGRLKDDPAIYDVYARYLVRFVQAYEAAGVPVDYLTVQNEPQNRTPDRYPGTDLPVAQEIKVIEALGPALRRAGLRTQILGYDHNWSTFPNDILTTPEGEDPETDRPYTLLESPAARYVAGTAFHCYFGDPSAQTALREAHPDKDIFFTECSGSRGATDPPSKYFNDTLRFHARNITIGTMRNWSRSAITWNLALDPDGNPNNGGCETCTGVVTIDGQTVTPNAEYYTLGHLSRFVRPGAVRIASTSFGTPAYNGQIQDVAFRNPDGSTALVVHNQNDEPRSFSVAVGPRSFDYTLPGGALATFVWGDDKALDSRYRLLDTSAATATASSSNPGEAPDLAVDDEASTRWASGTGQVPGMFLQVDLDRRQVFRRVVVDAGASTGDYARGWELQVSRNGTSWDTVGSGRGTGQLTTIDVRATSARYLRLVSTDSSGSWWSIADVRLYR